MKFREKYGFQLTFFAVLACFVAMVGVWYPSDAEKDVFRTRTVNPPLIGHWISGVEELKAVRAEIYAIEARVNALPHGGYSPEAHFANMKRLIDIEKSLLPIDGGYAVTHGVVPAYSSVSGKSESTEAAQIYRGLQIEIPRITNLAVMLFQRKASSTEDLVAIRRLFVEGKIDGLSMRKVVEEDYHLGPWLAWAVRTHLQSMFVVFFFFLLRAEIVGQKRRILVYDAPKTAFWMFFWPVGIFRYPTKDPIVFVRLVQRRLAMAMTFLFTVAIPNFALAQSGKADGEKKRQTEHTLVLEAPEGLLIQPPPRRNSFNLGVEAVNKYHGMAVGEIFAPEPAPRVMGRYTRNTDHGSLYLDSWNSAGRGFNNEADIGVGYARSGFDASITRFFVRGGDVGQIAVSKSGSVSAGERKVSLGASLFYYFGFDGTSPPGGVVSKFSASTTHELGLSGFRLTHNVALGIDNNPFGLGKGLSAVGFYSVQAGFKNAYLAWNASAPIRGQDNTTRGFRQSFSAGYRHAFAW